MHNASGCWVKTAEQMDEIASLGCIQTIVSKTCTLNAFDGHPSPNFFEFGQLSLNCKGMPNFGYVYYRNLWRHFVSQGITYVLSVDGADQEELCFILKDYDQYLAKEKRDQPESERVLEWVELNVSCPNKAQASPQEQARLLAYDPAALDRMLRVLIGLQLQCIRLLLKLAPYTDRWLLSQVATTVLNYHDLVWGVVCSNSIPNAHSGDLLSRPTAGISGLPAKLLSQANIAQFKKFFDSKGSPMLLIGCGGVETVKDVGDYLALGAYCVQVGRSLHLEGRAKLAKLSNVVQSADAKKKSAKL